MDKLIDNPWILRITALILAILLFFTVKPEEKDDANTFSGIKEETLEMPLNVRYDNNNFVVTGEPETVIVKIKGPMGIVVSAKQAKSFETYIELKNKTIGAHKVKVKVSGLSDKLDYTVEPKTVNVNVEERVSKQVKVEPQITQQQLATGHYVVAAAADPQTVTVTGAADDVNQIAYVKAIVPGSDIDKSLDRDVRVKAFDAGWNALNVSFSPRLVHVTVDVGEYHKTVPIVVKQKGTPADDVNITAMKPEKSTITLYGPKQQVEAIDALDVTVDVSDVIAATTKTVDVVLPAGVTYASDAKLNIDIQTSESVSEDEQADSEEEAKDAAEEEQQAQLDQKTLKNVPINVLNFDPDAYTIEFVSPNPGTVTLNIEGDKAAIEKLSAEDFNVSVEVEDVSEGTQTMPIHIEAPEGIKATASETSAKVKFTKKS
ncbi:CdaR family protein [Kurthia massiliensis]|uniref:CdaR family protein n=1 Tax=Kurthia massiliensis TaxID=1033739 RepID=UPI000287A423|nr:CdaR family protein [Kurthia massiliensis]